MVQNMYLTCVNKTWSLSACGDLDHHGCNNIGLYFTEFAGGDIDVCVGQRMYNHQNIPLQYPQCKFDKKKVTVNDESIRKLLFFIADHMVEANPAKRCQLDDVKDAVVSAQRSCKLNILFSCSWCSRCYLLYTLGQQSSVTLHKWGHCEQVMIAKSILNLCYCVTRLTSLLGHLAKLIP